MKPVKRKEARKESSSPELLGEVLSRLFAARGWGRRSERVRLEQAWAEVAGPAVATGTRLGSLRRGVLEILVGSAAMLQELAHFQKRRLLTELKARVPTPISELRFRISALQDLETKKGKDGG